jgi:hypothetical protein
MGPVAQRLREPRDSCRLVRSPDGGVCESDSRGRYPVHDYARREQTWTLCLSFGMPRQAWSHSSTAHAAGCPTG